MINRSHDLAISQQTKLLGISRGHVNYQPQPIRENDLALMHRIDKLHLEHPFMGARMLRDQLVRKDRAVGRKHVGTLMKRMGTEAVYRKPKMSKKHPGHAVYPYLLRGTNIHLANQAWALDTAYIPMAKGFVYLAAVVDWASRKVLAAKVAITLEARLAIPWMFSMKHSPSMGRLRSSIPTRVVSLLRLSLWRP